ncbi:hypothetical protein NLG97_g2607 [Lecanicillium saksenae]|uniref:Uncharacterized protein n=1 Tax=Lecanicillium saksenae TaxID=468837 RepID=A0ACC1R0I5_9HYPO|nr:hypothetical protein NLG97_g2607 [Lecanicillium saksenae]
MTCPTKRAPPDRIDRFITGAAPNMDNLVRRIPLIKRECSPEPPNQINGIGRLIDIEGAFNLRDCGGIHLSPTTATRRGVVFRSGHCAFLTESGKDTLYRLGITAMIDLRSPMEADLIQFWACTKGLAATTRDVLPPMLSLPLDEDFSLHDRFLSYKSEDAMCSQSTATRYFDTVCSDSGRARMRDLLVFIHEHTEDTFLIHCSLGKDRTGVVVALLLALLGASDEQIADDFALSGPGLASVHTLAFLFVEERYPHYDKAKLNEAVARMLMPDRQAMLILLQMLRDKFGSVVRFFRDRCGVDSSLLSSLKASLIVRRN